MDEKRLVDGTTALAEKQPRVIKIEPTERPQNVRLRVAAYTRVSSDSEDQLNSFAAQNRYYTELISSKAEWRMVDIYADEGITGTSVAKRDDFQRMMADCRRGLIDQILVKSISRFARNTKDCLQNIRELKELGVNVRFEREGIDTVNVSSELITAIYAAFAQKESESISGNMQWSYQRRMESGEFNTCKAPWGFRLDGRKLKICEPEADIVQRIFREYLSGKNPQEIADDLNASCLTERVWNYKAVLDEQTFLKEKRSGILADNNEQAKANQRIMDAAQTLENASLHITEWDESAVRQLVETVKILSKDEVAVTLKGGIEIRQKIMY